MDSNIIDKFWANIDRKGSTECWNWKFSVTGSGYARFRLPGKGRSSIVSAHRFAYELLVGPIPEGLVLDHLCRNRKCVNPAHLEPVTDKENILRGVGFGAINARKTHCINGHELTEENAKVVRNGWRECRECIRIRARKKYYADKLKRVRI